MGAVMVEQEGPHLALTSTYAIMNVVFRKGGKAQSVLKLYSRMVEHNEKAMDRFLVKALEHGLSAVDVQLLSKDRWGSVHQAFPSRLEEEFGV
ncbi:hypothetical protein E2I00_006836 [Balaenoptera physalus]|uniref:Uncharacterized protein n=1 Tax=Balaenoptera physalus TaxID=9770 RepID=A0A643BXA1_BALPH|nr:hypothetical protein E2I00_006836 [Balaenoptera physalus]